MKHGGVGLVLTALLAGSAQAAQTDWRDLLPGVAYRVFAVPRTDSTDAGEIHAVRIEPARARLQARMVSDCGGARRTAAEWCREESLAVAINLGMYQTDYLSNVGYARRGLHRNNGHWATKHKSALAFGPRIEGLPPARLVDLDEPGARESLTAYDTVVQNLRLIRSPGESVWGIQDKRWSEAAIAADREGRVLFLFTRTAWSMHEFTRIALDLPLDIERAMHAEGGAEASLSIHAGGVDLDLAGGLEGALGSGEVPARQWAVPNVIGVARDRAP